MGKESKADLKPPSGEQLRMRSRQWVSHGWGVNDRSGQIWLEAESGDLMHRAELRARSKRSFYGTVNAQTKV